MSKKKIILIILLIILSLSLIGLGVYEYINYFYVESNKEIDYHAVFPEGLVITMNDEDNLVLLPDNFILDCENPTDEDIVKALIVASNAYKVRMDEFNDFATDNYIEEYDEYLHGTSKYKYYELKLDNIDELEKYYDRFFEEKFFDDIKDQFKIKDDKIYKNIYFRDNECEHYPVGVYFDSDIKPYIERKDDEITVTALYQQEHEYIGKYYYACTNTLKLIDDKWRFVDFDISRYSYELKEKALERLRNCEDPLKHLIEREYNLDCKNPTDWDIINACIKAHGESMTFEIGGVSVDREKSIKVQFGSYQDEIEVYKAEPETKYSDYCEYLRGIFDESASNYLIYGRERIFEGPDGYMYFCDHAKGYSGFDLYYDIDIVRKDNVIKIHVPSYSYFNGERYDRDEELIYENGKWRFHEFFMITNTDQYSDFDSDFFESHKSECLSYNKKKGQILKFVDTINNENLIDLNKIDLTKEDCKQAYLSAYGLWLVTDSELSGYTDYSVLEERDADGTKHTYYYSYYKTKYNDYIFKSFELFSPDYVSEKITNNPRKIIIPDIDQRIYLRDDYKRMKDIPVPLEETFTIEKVGDDIVCKMDMLTSKLEVVHTSNTLVFDTDKYRFNDFKIN